VEDASAFEHRDRLPLGISGRVPLGFQLLVGIGGLVVLVAVAVALAVVLVQGVRSGTEELTAQEVAYSRAVDEAALRAKAMANDERGFLLSGSKSFMDRFDRRAVRVRASFAAAAAAAEEREQRATVEEASAGFEQWVHEVRDEVALFRTGAEEEAVTSALGPTRDLRLAFEESMGEAQRLAEGAIESRADSVSAASSQSIVILLVYLGVALLVAVLIGLWLVRTILRPVYALLAIFAEPGSTERLVERYSGRD